MCKYSIRLDEFRLGSPRKRVKCENRVLPKLVFQQHIPHVIQTGSKITVILLVESTETIIEVWIIPV